MIELKNLRPAIIGAAVIMALTAAAIFLSDNGATSWAIDYQVFWTTAHRSLDQVYGLGTMPFVYPPPALFLFKPLTGVPFETGYVAWTILSVVLFYFAASCFVGRWALLAILTPSAVRGLVLGQSSMFLAGLMFLAFMVRPFVGGLLIGIAFVIKPQLVLFAPLALLVRRDRRMLAGMAVSSAVLIAGSVLLWPVLWIDWIAALPAFRQVLHEANVMHMVISPAGRAEHWGLPPLPFLLLGITVGVAAVVTNARKVEGAGLVALITAASIVSSPYAHLHDMIGIVPFAILAMRQGDWLMVVGGALLFIGSFMLAPVVLLGGLIIATLCHWQNISPSPLGVDMRMKG